MPEPNFSLKKPCRECPFSRACEPGGTGGADPSVYVGQAAGPFFLPCHMAAGYAGGDKKDPALPQCAGAAVFRANCWFAHRMPDGLHSLPADRETVFADPAELISHHLNVPLAAAREFMKYHPVGALLDREFRRSGVSVIRLNRKE